MSVYKAVNKKDSSIRYLFFDACTDFESYIINQLRYKSIFATNRDYYLERNCGDYLSFIVLEDSVALGATTNLHLFLSEGFLFVNKFGACCPSLNKDEYNILDFDLNVKDYINDVVQWIFSGENKSIYHRFREKGIGYVSGVVLSNGRYLECEYGKHSVLVNALYASLSELKDVDLAKTVIISTNVSCPDMSKITKESVDADLTSMQVKTLNSLLPKMIPNVQVMARIILRG